MSGETEIEELRAEIEGLRADIEKREIELKHACLNRMAVDHPEWAKALRSQMDFPEAKKE